LKNLSLKQAAAIFMTVCATSLSAGVRAESGGWFSGISALPLTMQMDSDAGFDGSALSSKNRGDGYSDSVHVRPGSAFSAVPRSWVLGGTGTLSLNERFGLTGKLSSVRTEGDTTSNSVTHGLTDALPYNMMGLGMKYDITRSLRFQGGWDRYQLKYNRINGDAGVDLLSIGLKYGF
jgi:hypothetical protein